MFDDISVIIIAASKMLLSHEDGSASFVELERWLSQ